MQNTFRTSLLAAIALAAGTQSAAAQATGFVIIPALGGEYVSPKAISGDGTTIAGIQITFQGAGAPSIQRAFRWSTTQGPTNIGGFLPAGPFVSSSADAISSNGSLVFGRHSSIGQFTFAFPSTVTQTGGSSVVDVSADGAVVLTSNAVIAPGSTTFIPPLPGDDSAGLRAISADGTKVALTSTFFDSGSGYGYGGGDPVFRDEACTWNESAGTQGCGFLPGTQRSFATSISEDGAVVIGYCTDSNGQNKQGFRWTAPGGITPMPPASGQSLPANFEPIDSSADGSVIIGEADGQAVIWTPTSGYVNFQQSMIQRGYDLTAWTFFSLRSIDDAGQTVTGVAAIGSNLVGFVASLASSCSNPALPPWSPQRTVVVAEGDTLPGGTASLPTAVSINAEGSVLFSESTALFLTSPQGTHARVTNRNDPTYGSLFAPVLSDTGHVAALRARTVPINPLEDIVLGSIHAGTPGSFGVIADDGDPAPSDPGATLYTRNGVEGPFLSSTGLAAFQTSILLPGNTTANRCFVANLPAATPLQRAAPGITLTQPIQLHGVSDAGIVLRSSAEGIVAGGPPPILQSPIALVGAPAPGFPGGTFTSFTSPSIAPGGAVCFIANIAAVGGPTQAIYRAAPGQQPVLVAAKGDPVGSDTLDSIITAVITDGGSVFAHASLQSSDNSVIIKAKTNGTLVPLITAGDLLPGSSLCRAIESPRLVGVSGGRALILAQTQTLSSTGEALLARGEGEFPAVLAVTGEHYAPRPTLTGTVTDISLPPTPSSGGDGRAVFFKNNRALYTLFVNTGTTTRSVVVTDTLPPLACGGADLGSQGGAAGADGALDNNDFVAFIDLFFSQHPTADVGSQGGVRLPDGQFDNNDFVVFIDLFFNGCN